MKKKRTKKLNGIDIYLICSAILLILYTIVTQIIFVYTGGMEPSSLTISFFAAFGVTEGICCALIKNQKFKSEKSPGGKIDKTFSDYTEEELAEIVSSVPPDHDLYFPDDTITEEARRNTWTRQ